MSRKPQKKESENAKQNRCSVCENYMRKIEEVEQTLSGKETIITALQKQLKKCEDNYKEMFNNFEKMRFDHSTALQDNFSLKEINSKLQEVTLEKKKCSKCKEGHKNNLERSLNSVNQRELPNQLIQPLLKEVGNIEKLVDSQNRILQELIEKIVNEIKDTKSSCIGGQGASKTENDYFKRIESGDHLDLDTHPKFRKLVAEIEGLKSLLENHRRENDRMSNFLLDKADKLTQCNKISEIGDKKNCSATMADAQHNSIIAKLKNELKEKEQHFEQCTCQLIEQLNEMHANNQVLSDTLQVVTAENKNNLGIINNLKEELNRANQECEKKIDALKSRINQLENDLEENKDADKKLKDCIDRSDIETRNLKDRLKQLIEENNKLKDCKCDAEKELKQKLVEMEVDNETLKKELAEKNLELTEYEEENKNYCQRLEILTNYNGELTNKMNELQQELREKSKEVDTVNNQIRSLTKVQDQVNEVNKENKCLNEKCRVDQIEIADKTFQLDCLKKSIKTQLEELDKLSSENDELKKEIDRIKDENKAEIEKWQSMVNHSQNQVDMLLKEHDEKTSQIENVANELDNIRRSVTEDNDNFMSRIRQLETEKEELMKVAKEHEKCTVCTCDGAREEIERLKAELIKKQCIILELEKSVDSFNETMKSFDQTAGALTCENSCLKAEKDQSAKELAEAESKLAEKVDELAKLRKQLENAEAICGKCAKAARNLEVENTQLKTQRQTCLRENDGLKKELDRLKQEKGQIEKAIAENYQLQMELDALKSEHTRRDSAMSGKLGNIQQAYDELKNVFDLTNAENEKLRENIRKCTQSVEEAKKHCSCLEAENDGLKKETRVMTEEVDCLKTECDKLKKHCAKKCLEVQTLKETADEQRKERRVYEKDCQSLRQKQVACEKDLAQLNDKLDELKRNYDQKTQELKKLRKQYESCAKQSQITREEYNNLRKEYKEIKAMLSEQIKRYRRDTDSMEASQPCQVVTDLKRQLKEKENQMTALQQKLTESSYEIIELKDYVHKLICDNNVLKSAINSLICNLERKIKGPSFGSLPSNSAEAIAGEILNSLSSIENIVKSNGDICPRGCPIKKCDCMIEITSQYSKESQQGPSGQKLASRTISEPLDKPASAPLPRVSSEPRRDESETTDSEDPHSMSFMDKKSLEFFRVTIQDLKTKMDCTMTEKCCECEQLPISKKSK